MISAIVPIKRESQRVEYKNFREINGKPLFYWILSSLNSSDYIDEIIVNIDDEFYPALQNLQVVTMFYRNCYGYLAKNY